MALVVWGQARNIPLSGMSLPMGTKLARKMASLWPMHRATLVRLTDCDQALTQAQIGFALCARNSVFRYPSPGGNSLVVPLRIPACFFYLKQKNKRYARGFAESLAGDLLRLICNPLRQILDLSKKRNAWGIECEFTNSQRLWDLSRYLQPAEIPRLSKASWAQEPALALRSLLAGMLGKAPSLAGRLIWPIARPIQNAANDLTVAYARYGFVETIVPNRGGGSFVFARWPIGPAAIKGQKYV